MIVIINHAGDRLCKDGRWRSFANFGDYPENVRTYRRLTCAFKRARWLGASVARLPDDCEMNAAGQITQEITVPGRQGYTTTRRRHISGFILEQVST